MRVHRLEVTRTPSVVPAGYRRLARDGVSGMKPEQDLPQRRQRTTSGVPSGRFRQPTPKPGTGVVGYLKRFLRDNREASSPGKTRAFNGYFGGTDRTLMFRKETCP
jgi:hypothetical protein